MYVWKYQMVFLLKGDSFSKQAKFVFLNRNAYICFKKLLVRKEITFFHGKLKAYEFFFGEMMLSILRTSCKTRNTCQPAKGTCMLTPL